MSIVCEYCSNETSYHSSNVDAFTGKKFDIFFCNHCFVGKTNLHKDFDFTSYYPKNYYGEDGKRFNFLFEFLVLFARYLRSLFCKKLFNDNNIKLLDIGCGRGHFIYLMKKKGWSVYGSELSPTSAMSAKKKVGDDVIFVNHDLNDLKNIDINFNIITLWHVLEHVKNPKNIVNLIEKKLLDKGYLVIEVPNFDSLQRFIDKSNWILLECPRHIIHFTEKSLLNFFDNKKFNIIKKSTFSIEYGLYGMLQSLLNLFVPVPNYLFSFIRNKKAIISKIPLLRNCTSMFLTIIFFAPLLFASIFFELIAVLFKKGGVIRVVIQKNG